MHSSTVLLTFASLLFAPGCSSGASSPPPMPAALNCNLAPRDGFPSSLDAGACATGATFFYCAHPAADGAPASPACAELARAPAGNSVWCCAP